MVLSVQVRQSLQGEGTEGLSQWEIVSKLSSVSKRASWPPVTRRSTARTIPSQIPELWLDCEDVGLLGQGWPHGNPPELSSGLMAEKQTGGQKAGKPGGPSGLQGPNAEISLTVDPAVLSAASTVTPSTRESLAGEVKMGSTHEGFSQRCGVGSHTGCSTRDIGVYTWRSTSKAWNFAAHSA
ncbi:hypothetical protein NDU88_006686 [Pleurodeles waltl]|uniref:Uncharacterized protein n=1 Tax=Pleurodeles waltl TaxID=8319 RepID=A0AAV7WEB4_PLEWA|nr:hypothetical protein NDU88_006686 [Pleurodeles waltl]